jgi:transposase InsO family protein
VAQEAGDDGTRTRSVAAQHARISSPQGNPSLEAAFGREDPGGGFFQRCLAKNRGSTPAQQRLWRNGIYDQIREVMSLQGSLSIERMCQMVPVSRRGFYRSLKEQQPAEEEMEVRSAIQQIALEHRRRYGYRRITAELHRRGMPVNHKRVARIMREDNLLGMQPKQFVVTTNSNHKLEIYLNLAGRMKLTGINQLWVADITYIRLKAEFVYLAVILDGFSRKVVGWALDRTLAMRLTIGALEQAIESRQPEPGLVHHSDRGLQYASEEYIRVLEDNRVIPSMSRPANPYDNASCESFMKTLKREEIYANNYNDLEHLRANIEEFIEQYYNRLRLHSALGYRPPEEFEQQIEASGPAESRSATMVFFENKENSGKISKGLLGKGTQMPSPSPDPFSC